MTHECQAGLEWGRAVTKSDLPSTGMATQPMESWRPTIRGSRHIVSAGHYLAAAAAFRILESGGNAVDAGVAAAISSGVVQSDQVNCAGVSPMLIYIAATRRVICIDGVGVWPRAATCDYFASQHAGKIPEGIFRTVIPAAPAAWIAALRHFGTLPFGTVVAPAIELARSGFIMYEPMASRLRAFENKYRQWESSAQIYLPNGSVPKVGHRFIQSDLARSLQYMADEERAAMRRGRHAGLDAAFAAFYRGDIAAAFVRYHAQHGGLLTAADLAEYDVSLEDPVRAEFGDRTLYACGPWSQGPVLIQALRLAEAAGLSDLPHNSVEYLHRLVEIVKLAFADREAHYGDPRHSFVPLEQLLSQSYAVDRVLMIDPERAWHYLPPPGLSGRALGQVSGQPSLNAPDAAGATLDTTYVAVVDRFGNGFSCSPSDQSIDTPVIPGTGLCPSSRGSQSWVDPTHPAAVGPGRRPRLTPNPALMLDATGNLTLFGSPGGDVQVQAMLQVHLNRHLFGMEPQQAVEASRVTSYSFPDSFEPHASSPGVVKLEEGIERSVAEQLSARGHLVGWWPERAYPAGGVNWVERRAEDGSVLGAADPRRASYVIGW